MLPFEFVVFLLYLLQSFQPRHNVKTGRCDFCPNGFFFLTQCRVNISALQSKDRDKAPVVISAATLNVTIPGSEHSACFIHSLGY